MISFPCNTFHEQVNNCPFDAHSDQPLAARKKPKGIAINTWKIFSGRVTAKSSHGWLIIPALAAGTAKANNGIRYINIGNTVSGMILLQISDGKRTVIQKVIKL